MSLTESSILVSLDLMMPKSSPVRCTILALVAIAYKKEQHKNILPKAPVWSWLNTLRRLSQKSFYNSRVLERSQSRVPFYEEDVGAFYSSEVLPPFLVEQVLSLQGKSSPCRASLLLAAQVLSLQSKSLGIWNVVGKFGPSFYQGPHTKNGLDLFWAHGHGPIGLAKPYLIFYPLQDLSLQMVINKPNSFDCQCHRFVQSCWSEAGLVWFAEWGAIGSENYFVLPEPYKCVLPHLTWMVGLTN